MQDTFYTLSQQAINLATKVAEKYRLSREIEFLDTLEGQERLFRLRKAECFLADFGRGIPLEDLITSTEEKTQDERIDYERILNYTFFMAYYDDVQYNIQTPITRIKKETPKWKLRDGKKIQVVNPGKSYTLEVWPHTRQNMTINVTYYIPYQNENSIHISLRDNQVAEVQGSYKISEERDQDRKLQEKDVKAYREILENLTPWINAIT